MKTKFACILGLAVLVTSFICGGSLVYADALEAASSALQTLLRRSISHRPPSAKSNRPQPRRRRPFNLSTPSR